MPRILLEGVFVILSLMIITYNSILKPLFYKVYYFSLVNFNILPFISGFFRNFHLIDIDMTRLFFTLVVMIFAGLLIYSAHRHTNEKFTRNSLIAIPSYILFYSILSSTIMLLVFIDILMGKKQKW